jgi:hypothetical protein
MPSMFLQGKRVLADQMEFCWPTSRATARCTSASRPDLIARV